MKRLILIIYILGFTFLNAKTISATYQISYGIIDKMGIATTILNIDEKKNTYYIKVVAETKGIAKILSGGRTEVYESFGQYNNGILIPDKYIKNRKTNFSQQTKTYYFDNKNKKIIKEIFNGKETTKEINDYYASNDLLSLFFNLKNYDNLNQYKKLYAIGGKNGNGEISILPVSKKEEIDIKNLLDIKSGLLIKVKIDDDIFSSKNGELYINLDKDNLADKSILLNVLLFGDIIGKRIN
jgi:hypothetical protein